MHKIEGMAPRFVVCVSNAGYPASLVLHKIYRVLPDEDAALEGDVRVIDESGEDYLYPAEWFVPNAILPALAYVIRSSYNMFKSNEFRPFMIEREEGLIKS